MINDVNDSADNGRSNDSTENEPQSNKKLDECISLILIHWMKSDLIAVKTIASRKKKINQNLRKIGLFLVILILNSCCFLFTLERFRFFLSRDI